MTPIEEFALRLHVGARAIKQKRVRASIAELIEGALESVRAERLSQAYWNSIMQTRKAKKQQRAMSKLCVRCGVRESTPGFNMCAMCMLHIWVAAARSRGDIPHIKHLELPDRVLEDMHNAS